MNTPAPESTSPAELVASLNQRYEALHTAKEDAFWTARMGLAPDPAAAQHELDRRDVELARFLRDPEALPRVRAAIESAENAIDGGAAPSADDFTSLAGWLATFEAHAIESAGARELSEEIVALEGELEQTRARLQLSYEARPGERVPVSSVELGVRIASDPDARVRRSAFDALRSIETHVLANGFLDVVRARNRLGRMLGAEDYYDWKVRRVEGLDKRLVFAWLDELEAATRTRARQSLDELAAERGHDALSPWNLRYWVSGNLTAEQDPYFPFASALDRWGRSFAALGIRYRGAQLVLDLLDRAGKYENGFMHGPVPAWRERGAWRPARIQFTANAIPGLVGSGRRATETLFHEGGHAAHFANIDMPAPCFSQEYAPTSVAFAETQSMFLDSLISDPDWQARYARSVTGERMSDECIVKGIQIAQPFAAHGLRAMLAVCYAEKAIYEIPDAELSADRVLSAIRDVERRLCFLDEGSPRPVLSVPHLLSGESSAYYHGYVLAQMAVEQTRAHFVAQDGHLVDNPNVGPRLSAVYWQPGNALSFGDFIENLTGKTFSAQPLARRASRSADEAVLEARAALARERSIPVRSQPVDLDARVRVVHGAEEVASTDAGTFEECAQRFGAWIDARSSGARCARSVLNGGDPVSAA